MIAIFRHLFTVILLTSAAIAAPEKPSSQCYDITIPVSITSCNAKFKVATPQSDYDVTALSIAATTRSVNATAASLTGYFNNQAMYTISARYCSPPASANGVLLFLTHGLGFDKTYWDFPLENGRYSFINPALSRGYSTFAIDRISTGGSSKPDPIDEAQFATEVAVNIALTQKLRSSSIDGLPQQAARDIRKIVHIGHSFGSQIANGLAQMAPGLADGIVFTGWSTDPSYKQVLTSGLALRIANTNQPTRFGLRGSDGYRPNGYVTWVDKYQNLFTFFQPGSFSTAVLEYTEANKMPFTIGETLTLLSGSTVAQDYRGPVLVITGEKDEPYCGRDCSGILEKVQDSFPRARSFRSLSWKDTGHALNLHYTAGAAYGAIFDWLRSVGL